MRCLIDEYFSSKDEWKGETFNNLCKVDPEVTAIVKMCIFAAS